MPVVSDFGARNKRFCDNLLDERVANRTITIHRNGFSRRCNGDVGLRKDRVSRVRSAQRDFVSIAFSGSFGAAALRARRSQGECMVGVPQRRNSAYRDVCVPAVNEPNARRVDMDDK